MRIALAIAALAALLLLPKSAEAQEYPWCATYHDADGGEITTCGYVSWQQCIDTAGGGVGGHCRMNPSFVAGPQRQPAPRAVKKKRQHS